MLIYFYKVKHQKTSIMLYDNLLRYNIHSRFIIVSNEAPTTLSSHYMCLGHIEDMPHGVSSYSIELFSRGHGWDPDGTWIIQKTCFR